MCPIGVYFVLQDETQLPQCLACITPISQAVVLLDQDEGEHEKHACCLRQRLHRLCAQSPEAESLALLLPLMNETPSVDACLNIGEYFYHKSLWKQAIFWFENALRMEDGESSFVCLRLITCYGELGQWADAAAYMKLAELQNKQQTNDGENA